MTDQPEQATPAAQIHRPRKPRFHRGITWVAIKYIRPSSGDMYEPGEEIPSTARRHYLLYLWRRNLIGPKGDPWTDSVLAATARREERKDAEPHPVAAAAQAAQEEAQPVAEPEPAESESEGEIEIVAGGAGWYTVLKDGTELAKLRGMEAVNAWLNENGYDEVKE